MPKGLPTAITIVSNFQHIRITHRKCDKVGGIYPYHRNVRVWIGIDAGSLNASSIRKGDRDVVGLLNDMGARHDESPTSVNYNACGVDLAIRGSIRGIGKPRLRIDKYRLLHRSARPDRNADHAWNDFPHQRRECRRRRCFSEGAWRLSPACRREYRKEHQREDQADDAIAAPARGRGRTSPGIQALRQGLDCRSMRASQTGSDRPNVSTAGHFGSCASLASFGSLSLATFSFR